MHSAHTLVTLRMQIVKSFMYKGWLLLDRSDTKTVDEYLRTSCETGMPETTVASPPNVSQPTPQHYEVPNPGPHQTWRAFDLLRQS